MSEALQTLYRRLPIPLQEVVVALSGWRSYRDRFGPAFHRILAELQRLDEAPEEVVREDQDRRLRETVRFAAATVPYYRDLFRLEGIDPKSIRGVDDLPRIPPLEKETVRRRGETLLSEAVPRRARIRGHSSGTTGTALELGYTREALAWEYAVNWRQRGWFGIRFGDRYAAFGGQSVVPIDQPGPPFWRYDRPRRRVLFSLYHMAPQHLAAYAAELVRPGYAFWQGYPSSLALVAAYLRDEGIELGTAAPRAVFTSSESLLDFQREVIGAATGAPVADRYGHSELAVSVLTCPEGRYHVDTEFCAVEVEPQSRNGGHVRGEILATGFANRAMPLLRYRTGDVATSMPDVRCPCGRARPLLERIDGRVEDYVVTPDGRRIGRMDHVFKDTLQVREAQIVQPALDRIVVRLVPRPGFDGDARRGLERELRSRIGDALAIEFEEVDAIPRLPNGKFRAVVSELGSGRLAAGAAVVPGAANAGGAPR